MTNKERQITLETRMYRKKTFGKEKYCNHCWACMYHKSCFARSEVRSVQNLCLKAENRMNKNLYKTEFVEILQKEEKKERFLLLGLKRSDLI